MIDANDTQTASLIPEHKKRGRTPVHANNAARQRAYRARKKEMGLREVRAWAPDRRDPNSPLVSDVIDLSEVRQRAAPRATR